MAMKKLLLSGVASLLMTISANAMNSSYYTCGDDTEVALAIAKDQGKVLGENVWIKIRLRGKQPQVKRVTGGTVVFEGIDQEPILYRNGVKIKCTKYGDGFSDPDTR
jgi:hypothetical protein